MTKEKELKVTEGGTLRVDFKKQMIVISFKDTHLPKHMSCTESFNLWKLLDTVFTTKEFVKKIKVYDCLGKEINLVETLKRWGKIK